MPDELLCPLFYYPTFTQRSYGHHPEILCLTHNNSNISIVNVQVTNLFGNYDLLWIFILHRLYNYVLTGSYHGGLEHCAGPTVYVDKKICNGV